LEGEKKCTVDGCTKPGPFRNMCNSHYIRWKNHGDALGGKPSPKVLKAIDHEDGTRTCSECEVRQPLNNFHRDSGGQATLGRRSKCKACRGKQVAEWYAQPNVREKHINRERKKRVDRGEEIRARDRERYQENPDGKRAAALRWAKENPTKAKAIQARRRALKQAATVGQVTEKDLLQMFERNAGLCFYCNEVEASTIDHVVPLVRGGTHSIGNLVPCCKRCNSSKGALFIVEWRHRNRSKYYQSKWAERKAAGKVRKKRPKKPKSE
jgi:5-methylcytosine-specific restriction endonuclease McrA